MFRIGACGRCISPVLRLPDKPSLVVLPLQPESGDAEQEDFAQQASSRTSATALARSSALFVIARNCPFASPRATKSNMRQVGRELGVRYVVEGSVRRAGRRVRVTGHWSLPTPATTSGRTGSSTATLATYSALQGPRHRKCAGGADRTSNGRRSCSRRGEADRRRGYL